MAKQLVTVLEAVNMGCETSDQVSAVTGLPVATASACLSALANDGLVRRVRRAARRFNARGRASHLYAPAGRARA